MAGNHHHHHDRFNVRDSKLSTGWTVPPKICEFVEQMFYGRKAFLAPTISTLEPMTACTQYANYIIFSSCKNCRLNHCCLVLIKVGVVHWNNSSKQYGNKRNQTIDESTK